MQAADLQRDFEWRVFWDRLCLRNYATVLVDHLVGYCGQACNQGGTTEQLPPENFKNIFSC